MSALAARAALVTVWAAGRGLSGGFKDYLRCADVVGVPDLAVSEGWRVLRTTIKALVAASPTFSGVERTRLGRRVLDYNTVAELVDHLAEGLLREDSGEPKAVLAEAERMLDTGDEAAIEIVGTGLIEGLHNCVSHIDSAVEPKITAMLPDGCRSLWEQIRLLHSEVAEWLPTSPDALDEPPPISMFESATVPKLRSYARTSYWRSPKGIYVGTTDVLNYHLSQFEDPEAP